MSVFNDLVGQKVCEEVFMGMLGMPMITTSPFTANKISFENHHPLVGAFDVYEWMIHGIEPEISLVDSDLCKLLYSKSIKKVHNHNFCY